MPVSRWSAEGDVSAAARRMAGPALELPNAADHRPQAVLDVAGRTGAALEAVEDIDDRVLGQDAPRGDALGQLGDEEDARAGRPERRRRPVEADPIGVRLDDGARASGRGKRREPAPIAGKRAEIDCQASRRRLETRGSCEGFGDHAGSHSMGSLRFLNMRAIPPSRRRAASISPRSLVKSLRAR